MTTTATTAPLTITASALAAAMRQMPWCGARPTSRSLDNRTVYVRASSVAAAQVLMGRAVTALGNGARDAGRKPVMVADRMVVDVIGHAGEDRSRHRHHPLSSRRPSVYGPGGTATSGASNSGQPSTRTVTAGLPWGVASGFGRTLRAHAPAGPPQPSSVVAGGHTTGGVRVGA